MVGGGAEEGRLWAQAEVLALELQGMEKEVEGLRERWGAAM